MRKPLNAMGFTLIELLIVVAIIAILAAIAVPNFLAAQTRSKVARVKGNMRTSATGLEAYYIDNNAYPASRVGGVLTFALPLGITTPVAYITSLPDDIFDSYAGFGPGFIPLKYRAPGGIWSGRSFAIRLYMENPADAGNRTSDVYTDQDGVGIQNVYYALGSLGPGQKLHQSLQTNNSGFWDENSGALSSEAHWPGPYRMWYDPTNGTVSIGWVARFSSGVNTP